jgi:hypothetical protein
MASDGKILSVKRPKKMGQIGYLTPPGGISSVRHLSARYSRSEPESFVLDSGLLHFTIWYPNQAVNKIQLEIWYLSNIKIWKKAFFL